MQVAQMTWYRSSNYGSVLQAYALQCVLGSLGATSSLIRYDPAPYQQRNQSALRKSKPFRILRRLQQRAMGCAQYESADKSNSFSQFTQDYFNETEPVASSSDFENLTSMYDAFICGSDQIWSPRCFDPRYFLDFVDSKKRKIAYAPSFGCDSLPSEIAKEMSHLIESFDSLSAREVLGAHMINELIGRKCEVVVDPVLLLDPKDWMQVASEVNLIEKPYCLCYFLGSSKENWLRAVSVAERKGCRLVTIPVFKRDAYREGEIPCGVGPREFLGLIANANYVCTDSFHGLVFSTIFHRDFSVFERFPLGSSGSQNVRIENYLEAVGLSNRLLKREEAEKDPGRIGEISYESVECKIKTLREHSLNYLRESLGLL